MNDKTKSEIQILLNQSAELLTFREISIQNIQSSSSTYFTFLGLMIAAAGLFINGGSGINNIFYRTTIIVLSEIVLILFGCFIYHHILSFFVNQFIYTQLLNLTRGHLVNTTDLSKKTFLPMEIIQFDNRGHLDEKFSKKGIINWIKWTNTILISALVIEVFLLLKFGFLTLPYLNWKNYITPLFLALLFGYMAKCIHEYHFNDLESKAIRKLNCLTKGKELPKDQHQ